MQSYGKTMKINQKSVTLQRFLKHKAYMVQFEDMLHEDLCKFLVSMKEIDEHFPSCEDVEDKWQQIVKSYVPDGVKEFNDYPSASLGWMMYIGMAVAKFWDVNWEFYSTVDDLYALLRDQRGYDEMDEYICEEVLGINGVDQTVLGKLVGECAARVYHALRRQNVEPGTKEAFMSYVSCLHQLYQMGVAVQLKRMGYHMSKM